jgi:hypothetical protein
MAVETKGYSSTFRCGRTWLLDLNCWTPNSAGGFEWTATPVSKLVRSIAKSDGTIHVPSFDLSLSVYMSAEAKKSLAEQLRPTQIDPNTLTADRVAALRVSVTTGVALPLRRMQERYPVKIRQIVLAGLRAHSVVPKGGTNTLMSPVTSPEMLANSPQTLILTATRAEELSAAVHPDTELIEAGATAELHVWDGRWRGFFMDPDLPESKEDCNVIIKFFQRHLGHGVPRSSARAHADGSLTIAGSNRASWQTRLPDVRSEPS